MSDSASRSAGPPVYSEHREEPDFRGLLEEFAATRTDRLEQLHSVFAAGRIDDLRVQAHQLKGAGGGYGFPELSDLAGQLEVACTPPHAGLDVIFWRLDLLADYLSRIEA